MPHCTHCQATNRHPRTTPWKLCVMSGKRLEAALARPQIDINKSKTLWLVGLSSLMTTMWVPVGGRGARRITLTSQMTMWQTWLQLPARHVSIHWHYFACCKKTLIIYWVFFKLLCAQQECQTALHTLVKCSNEIQRAKSLKHLSTV